MGAGQSVTRDSGEGVTHATSQTLLTEESQASTTQPQDKERPCTQTKVTTPVDQSPQHALWTDMLFKGWTDGDQSSEDFQAVLDTQKEAWNQIMKWEDAFHSRECANPQFKKFGGKNKYRSLESKFHNLKRPEYPFMSLDWVIDRCGQDVRYVVDYYEQPDVDPSVLEIRKMYTSMFKSSGVYSSDLTFADVKVSPGLDSLSAVKDRFLVALYTLSHPDWYNFVKNNKQHSIKYQTDSKDES